VILKRIANVVPEKMGHLGVNCLDSPLRKFQKGKKIRRNRSNIFFDKSFLFLPDILLIILSLINCKSSFLSLEKWRGTPK
jgi:hypothetical protein